MDTESVPGTSKSYMSFTENPRVGYRLALKRKFVSPIHILLLALSAIIPVASLAPVHAQSPTVAVNPSTVAAGLGSSFTVTIDLTDVANVVGYDVSLFFNNAALSITSVDFKSAATLFGGLGCAPACNLGVVALSSNALGEVRSARALLAGNTAQSPGTLVSVTFSVTGSQDSPLTLDGVQVAQDVGGNAVPAPVTAVSGNFFLPPNILFTAPNLSQCTQALPQCAPVQHIKFNPAHTGNLPIICSIQLDPNAPRAGFGGCMIDVRNPNGVDSFSSSNLAFLFPGQSGTVTATFTYTTSASLGSYSVFATALDCVANDLSSCTLGPTTVGGLHFKMNP